MTPATFQYVIIVFCCLFTTLGLVYVFSPTRDADTGVEKTRLAYLYERKEVVYENLRDLNFEFKSGKFTQADYEGMRSGMEAEAARILAEIEQLEAARA
jgi:hypothetical protein